MSAINAGDTIYIKGGDTWDKTSGVPQMSSGSFDFQLALVQVTQPKVASSETINDHTTCHVTGTLSAPTPVSGLTVSPTTVDLWIRQDTFFPAQMEFHLTSVFTDPLTNKPATSQTSGTPTYTSWNTGVIIALLQV